MKKIISILLIMFLAGCSEKESADTTAVINTIDSSVTLNTRDLVADKSFDFKINREIKLIVTNADTSKGVLTVYKNRDISELSDQVFADPMSRITSVISIAQTTVDLMINDNWNEIVIAWVPESANSLEIVKVVKLNPEISIYTIAL